MSENEKAGNSRQNTILYYDADAAIYQIVTCYLNLTKFKVVASLKATDVLHKLDRQKFSCIVLGPDSDGVLDQILSTLSSKDSLNLATPVVILTPATAELNVEETYKDRIHGVVKRPFKLSGLHQTMMVAIASAIV